MDRWRGIWGTALYDARVMALSPRFVMLSLLSYIFMDMVMDPFSRFAAAFHLGIAPAVLPFYLSNESCGNLAFLLLVLLFSDVPLKSGGQNFLVQRGGLARSGAGHVLAMFLAGALFVLEQFLFSVLTALPDLLFGGWGKVWGSFASGQAADLGFATGIRISGQVLWKYGPWQAAGLSLLLFFLTGCSYALIVFILNGLGRGRLGTVAMSAWSAAWILLDRFPLPAVRRLLAWSPQTWNDLSRLTPGGALRQAGVLAVAVLVLSAVAVFLVKRRKIEMVK